MRKESIRFYVYGIIALVIFLLVVNKGDTTIQPSKIANTNIEKSLNDENVKNKFLFVGILTMIHKFHRRSLIRDCYLRNIPSGISVKFIFGKPKNELEQNLLDMEASLYNDIVVLDIEENLDDGKTWHFMKYASDLQQDYKFLLKTDDDVFLHLHNLNKRLVTLVQDELKGDVQGVYMGRHVTGTIFMAGMGYILSFDLVHFIANDPYASSHTIGQEDGLVASWLKQGDQIKHFISEDAEVTFSLLM